MPHFLQRRTLHLMSYTIFRSPAIVIAHTPRGEADRMVTLLTQEHGVITARVQSARLITSRLRYGTQFLTQGIFEYIRARDTWRLVGVHETTYPDLHRDMLSPIALLCKDIIHFVQGEEQSQDMYQAVYDVIMGKIQERCAERVLIARIKILHALGYIDQPMDTLEAGESLTPETIKTYHQMILNAYHVSQM